MNVLVINGHPRRESLSEALADAYIAGALSTGVSLKKLVLTDLVFDLHVRYSTPHLQHREPDIDMAQDLFAWADHIVFVYPTWWGTMPALLKGFLDRVLTSGFAFVEIEGGTKYAPLLRGKTAQLITTMDTPVLVYKLIYHAPGHNAMRKAALGFCGFKMGKTLNFGPVRDSTEARRKSWLKKASAEGAKLKRGSLSGWKKFMGHVSVWLKALRLQFYPMSFIAYTIGAFAAQQSGLSFSPLIFWMGYGWLFFLEVATVLSNERFDFLTDHQNKYFSPFNGGSRVIVDELLSLKKIKLGIGISVMISLLFFCYLCVLLIWPVLPFAIFSVVISVLALGYTIPPLKLSYRGLGEITVGITHSFAVVLCGWMLQGGSLRQIFPWWLSLPLFFSVLPSITLSGIPDHDADKAAGKRTLAVRFGKKGAAGLAIAFTLLAAITVIAFRILNILPTAFDNLLFFVIPHAIFLNWLLFRYIKNESSPHRIDSLMVASLTYILWFGVIPLINLW